MTTEHRRTRIPGKIDVLAAGSNPLLAYSGCEYLFDASAILATDGSALSQWEDLSGYGRHATQSTESYQPIYRATGLNGLPAVEFDNSNDYLLMGSATLTDPVSFVAIYQPQGGLSAGTGVVNVECQNVSGADNGIYCSAYSTNCLAPRGKNGTSSGSFYNSPAIVYDTNKKLTIVLCADGSYDPTVRVNGVARTRNSSDGWSANYTKPYLGYKSNCRISVVAIYSVTLSSDDITAIEAYLMDKYGI